MAQSEFDRMDAGAPVDEQSGGENLKQAIAHGAAISASSLAAQGYPDDLADALQRAAQTSHCIRYLDASGAETSQTYQELWTDAQQIAVGLKSCGRLPGALVVVQCAHSPALITAVWGCVLAGAVPVPIAPRSPQSSSSPLRSALALLESPMILTEECLRHEVGQDLEAEGNGGAIATPPILTLEELRAEASDASTPFTPWTPQADDLALLLLTSGSTGTPKGVMLTHRNLRVSTFGMASVNGLSADSITLNWMPLEHVASLVMFHLTEVFLGCEQIHASNELVLKAPLTWLDLIDRYRVTATWAPNFAYGLVNDQVEAVSPGRWDLSCLRWMGNGAEAVVGKTTRRFLQLLQPHGLGATVVSPGYGMSETCSGIVHSHRFSLDTTTDDDTFVDVGRPIPGVSLRIVAEADQVVAEGIIGRLQVKGLTVMAGYYQRPDLNEEVFTADGWFNTGDLAFLHHGRLTITGRQKDVIILNGVNYYSHDIEAVVDELDGVEVSYTAACGVRRSDDGSEQLAIFFHPSAGLSTEEQPPSSGLLELMRQIRAQVMQRLGVAPSYVIPVERHEIPKTAIGKIQRSPLSQRFAAGGFDARLAQVAQAQAAARGRGDRPQTELEQRIAAIWQAVLQIDAVGSYDTFFELGGTSLRLMQVLSRIQTDLDPSLTAVTLFQYPTVASLAEHLSRAQNPQSQPVPIRPRSRQTSDTAVAVIGMAGRFPGARNLEEFWRNLCDGVESITFFSDEEIFASGIDPALVRHPDYVKASPILDDVEGFDAHFFGYSPREAELMDPQQRLLLECAWESLETAGYDPLTYLGSIGLYAGASMNTYLLNHVYPQRHTLDPHDSLDVLTLSSLGGFQMTVANDKDYLTTRVSYKLNLRGPSINVQTACSTSLVAIHLAAQSVLQGECDMALAGGVSVETPQNAGYLYQDGMILSPDGHCRAFDAQAQGTLFGSGVGVVVLKRLDEAIANHDCIYAVIKGSAVGNDGGQKVGYLAPRSEGQTTVAAEALAIANISADSLGYVEAHGTGTALGDPIEIAGLTQAFRLSTQARQFCPIGSVKTNVGHLNIASGVVGFIKTALALYHGQIPPSLHFKTSNPQIDFANSPFYVNTELKDWPQGDTPRRASVNSLGIGGTNVHVVLEEGARRQKAEGRRQKAESKIPELLVLSAKTAPALRQLAERYRAFLAERPEIALGDVCFTASVGRSHQTHRLALVARSVAEMGDRLRAWLAGESVAGVAGGTVPSSSAPIAFLFTGQGAQSVNMGRDLYDTHPVFRDAMDRCADRLQAHGVDVLGVLYPEAGVSVRAEGSVEAPAIEQTAYAQPALFALEYALAQLWLSWGVRPAAVMGHSIGEYVAACIAGVFSLEDALTLVAARGRLMQQLPAGGAMVAVMANERQVTALLPQEETRLAIAALNSPRNTVVSGEAGAIARFTALLTAKGLPHKPLRVSHAFHSPLMEPMLEAFRQVAETVTYSAPTLDLISNVTGQRADATIATPDYWVRHVRQPVCFAQGITTLYQQGITTFIECGSRPVLTILGQATLGDDALALHWLPSLRSTSAHASFTQAGHLATEAHPSFGEAHSPTASPSIPATEASVSHSEADFPTASPSIPSTEASSPHSPPHSPPYTSDVETLLSSLAALYSQGHPIDWHAFHAHRPSHRIPLPTYPFQHQRYWLDRPDSSSRADAHNPQAFIPRSPTDSHNPKSKIQNPKSSHPFLSIPLNTPFNTLFQHTLTEPGFLTDHQVYGQILFPGAGFLDLAIAAGAIVMKTDRVALRAVAIAQSLSLSDLPRTLQTILTPEDGGYRFQIYSQEARPSGDGAWVLHCDGQVVAAEREDVGTVAIAPLRATLPNHQTAADHYLHCERLGLHYGDAFRGVHHLWRRSGEALVEIAVPDAIPAQGAGYRLHPALLDACFQGVLAALPDGASSAAYVPIGVDHLQWHHPLPTQPGQTLWSWVKLRHPIATDTSLITADVQILDETGRVLALASGLSARRVTPDALRPDSQTPPWRDWLYRVAWHPLPPLTDTAVAVGSWLVVGDDEAALGAIATHTAARSQAWVCAYLGTPSHPGLQAVDPDDSASVANLLAQCPADLPLQGVVYWVNGDSVNDEPDTLPAAVERLTHGALHLVQALIRSSDLPTPRLWLVTRGSQPVSGNETAEALPPLATAPLWALGHTIAQEHPELGCTCLDLDPNASPTDTLTTLITELTQGGRMASQEGQSAYRAHVRHGARLVRVRPDFSSDSAPDSAPNLQLQIDPKGTLDNLRWVPVPRRVPGPHEVELQVDATGLNFRDVLNALDLYPGDPGPLGLECVGTVVAVGSQVTTVQLGDAAMAIAPASFSQYVTVSADLVAPMPHGFTLEAAATIPTAFLTAYYALCQVGQMQAGDRVLIHAAAGGVGQAAAQLAQRVGAEVFATASPKKWDILHQQGIRHVFHSRTLAFAEGVRQATNHQGVTLVLNSLSGDFIPQSLDLLAPGGRFLEIGKSGIWSAEQVAHHRPDIAYHIIDLVALTQQQPQQIQTLLRQLIPQFQTGQLQPLPVYVFDGDRAIDAFRHMQNAQHIGKVVVRRKAEGRRQKAESKIQNPKSKIQNPKSFSSYLITGGTGALGLRLIQWLADRGARHLVLLSRTAPSPAADAVIRQLQQSGVTVHHIQADLTHLPSLQTALTPYLQPSTQNPKSKIQNPPIRSVFHLAGLIDDGVLQQQTATRFDAVLAPKVRGAWNLHQLTRHLDLDLFVMFSSAASLIGSAGQGNYAAANGFLEAIAHHRHRLGLPALSINWGAWADGGLAANTTVNQRLARIGTEPIPPETGLEILGHLLTQSAPQLGVLPGQGWMNGGDRFFASLLADPEEAEHAAEASSHETSAGIVAQLRLTEPEARRTVLMSHLRRQVASVLGMDAALLDDVELGFTDLGLDSLTSVELRNRLQTSLERPFPATLVYDYPTMAALTDYLLRELWHESEGEVGDSSTPNVEILSPQEPQPDSATNITNVDVSIEGLSDAEAEALLLKELENFNLEDSEQ